MEARGAYAPILERVSTTRKGGASGILVTENARINITEYSLRCIQGLEEACDLSDRKFLQSEPATVVIVVVVVVEVISWLGCLGINTQGMGITARTLLCATFLVLLV